MDLYAVFGHPIGHSKSPLIHRQFALQTGQNMAYTAVQPPLDGFESEAEKFIAQGGRGFNITVPFKENAARWVQRLSERAELAGAVNTVYLNDRREICGENTDGIGLVRDLTMNHGLNLRGQRILVLGAGGAVRGVLKPLLDCRPDRLIIANRTEEKAEHLAQHFKGYGNVEACIFSRLSGEFDTIINGTSAGLAGAVPAIPDAVVAAHTVTYDMLYGEVPTAFNLWSKDLGSAKQIDGLGMLVEQAAEAFLLWRGVRPETAPVMECLRSC